jgi:cob(I)alamin adenosyltransferase
VPRITKVYTRTGDQGTTGLGFGDRIDKDDPRIEAYGTVDELSSAIGVAVATGLWGTLATELSAIQNQLFHLGADLCAREEDKQKRPLPRVELRHIEALEKSIDAMTEELGPLANFILPGGSAGAAALHTARTICRRAERRAVTLARMEPVGEYVVPYLNRLSDALFVMARFENLKKGVPDVLWDSHA